VAPDGLVREPGALKPPAVVRAALGLLAAAALALFPLVASGYTLALGISVLSFTVLATAWALFSGPTRYISLATAAFFGIGAYTVAVLGEKLPWPLVLAVAALIGIAVALVVGLSTLRLAGIYFVIFSFGLAELVRQVVTWYEANIHRSVGRYIFVDITQSMIFWQLLALAVLVFLAGWLVGHSRLGLALRVIGEDESVARHCGVDAARAKLTVFALSATFMTLTGAIMAPRWTYVDPVISFNAATSFETLIMALFGGAARLLGPLLGAVPLVLLFELLSANFPNTFSILLGVAFMLIVYALPNGVIGLVSRGLPRLDTTGIGARLAERCGGFLRRPSPRPAAGAPSQPVLAAKGLRKAFGGLVAVDHLDIAVGKGEIIGLIGPNGSGKTTVLNLISGALRSDGGKILLRGRPIETLPAHRIAQLGVSRTFQLVRVLGAMSCAENVIAGLAFRSPALWGGEAARSARALLERVGLGEKQAVLAEQLTYIDQKRLELARALASGPELLLLDEWLAGLNPTELADGIALVRSLRDEGLAVIVVEHVMDAIRSLCDRCVVMNAGRKIGDGPPAVVLADREVVRAYLGDADA
jgi:branched-chain amino acid transport system permease protein